MAHALVAFLAVALLASPLTGGAAGPAIETRGLRESPGVSDTHITTAVKTRFSQDTDLKNVKVRTDAGVVTLTGKVPTVVASAKASEMARDITGVRAVRNELGYTR